MKNSPFAKLKENPSIVVAILVTLVSGVAVGSTTLANNELQQKLARLENEKHSAGPNASEEVTSLKKALELEKSRSETLGRAVDEQVAEKRKLAESVADLERRLDIYRSSASASSTAQPADSAPPALSTSALRSTVDTAPPPGDATQPRYRIGAVCRDGSESSATGRGACSHHGGVDHWVYNR